MPGVAKEGVAKTPKKGGLAEVHIKSMCLSMDLVYKINQKKKGRFKDGSSRPKPRRSSYGGVCVPGEWREVGR